MDIWTALKIIGRNWFVVAPMLLLTVILGVVIPGSVRPTYETNAQVIMLAPSVGYNSDGTPSQRNPYQIGGGAEGNLASTVVGVTRTDNFATAAVAAGAVRTYEIGAGGGSPVIGITVEAATPAAALKTQGLLIDMVAQQLARLQESAGAPPATWITASVLDASQSALPQTGRKTRMMIVVSLIGIALSCTLGFISEAVRARSRRSTVDPPRHLPGQAHPGSVGALTREARPPLLPGETGGARRAAIEAMAWSPPPGALPFQLERGDNGAGRRDHGHADPGHDDHGNHGADPAPEVFNIGVGGGARGAQPNGNGNGNPRANAPDEPQNGPPAEPAEPAEPPELPFPPAHR